ncbi:uncharacterized protein LOC134242399 [Saccostrea cucullata]|uniref:uncharacterized protein LOC134242399 n=1 Tax=Saccostrea cuccullata TaxID=36930 RepID=UPI002ED38838
MILSLLIFTCFSGIIFRPIMASTTSEPMTTTTAHGHHHHHTHAPKTTHEPNELESFTFYYDYSTHVLAVKSSLHICYLYKTSAQEQIDVHTSHGLHVLEKNLIELIDAGSAMQPITKDALTAMGRSLAHFCSHVQVYMQLN